MSATHLLTPERSRAPDEAAAYPRWLPAVHSPLPFIGDFSKLV